MSFDLDGYIDVAERIRIFAAKHPQGSLQPVDPAQPYRIEIIDGKTFVVYAAAAYRTADDPRPGIGIAAEPIPGKTPYTKDSEFQNAETAAWGRAIVAVLAADTKKVASKEEVRNRSAGREPPAREAVTDVEWYADFGRRIDECVSIPELRGLWSELRAMTGEGRVAQADHDAVEAVLKARAEELPVTAVPA